MKSKLIQLAVAAALTVGAVSVNASTEILSNVQTSSFSGKSFSGSASWTYDTFFDLAFDLSGKGTVALEWTLTAIGLDEDDGDYSVVKSSGFGDSTVWEDLGPGSYSFSYSATLGKSSKLDLALTSSAVPAAPVPEPETYAMLLVGLGLAGVAARRRRTL